MRDYYANPANTQIRADGGDDIMGSLASLTDGNRAAQFSLDGRPFVVSFIRVHFSGSGANTANVGVNIDSGKGERFDALLHTIESRGLNADVNWRIPLDEIKDWLFGADDMLVLTWANPHVGSLAWGAEVGLIPVE